VNIHTLCALVNNTVHVWVLTLMGPWVRAQWCQNWNVPKVTFFSFYTPLSSLIQIRQINKSSQSKCCLLFSCWTSRTLLTCVSHFITNTFISVRTTTEQTSNRYEFSYIQFLFKHKNATRNSVYKNISSKTFILKDNVQFNSSLLVYVQDERTKGTTMGENSDVRHLLTPLKV